MRKVPLGLLQSNFFSVYSPIFYCIQFMYMFRDDINMQTI